MRMYRTYKYAALCLAILFSFLLNNSLNAQTWEQRYDFNRVIQKAIELGDGSIAAITTSGPPSAYVFRTDSEGELSWSELYAETTFEEIIELSDGLALIGHIDNGTNNDDVIVVKLNHQGNEQWRRIIGGTDKERGFGLGQNADGSIQLIYLSVEPVSSFSGQEALLHTVQLDPTGDILYHKSYDQDSVEVWPRPKMLPVDDGYIISTRPLSKYVIGSTARIFKIDYEGDVLWDNRLTDLRFHEVNELAINENGEIGVLGKVLGGPTWYGVLNEFGNTLWTRNLIPSSAVTQPFTEHVISDGSNFVFSKTISNPAKRYPFSADDYDVIYFKTDNAGNIIWSRVLEPTSGYQAVEDLIALSDGNYLFTGHSEIDLDGNATFFRKTNPNGLLDGQEFSGIDFTTVWGDTKVLRCSSTPIDISMTATTNCSMGNDLNWQTNVDFSNDGTIDLSFSGNSFQVIDSMLIYDYASSIDFIVTDECGQTDTATIDFVVYDAFRPDLNCRDTLWVDLTNADFQEISASDFIESVVTDDICNSIQEELILYVGDKPLNRTFYTATKSDFGCVTVTNTYADYSTFEAPCTAVLCVSAQNVIEGKVFDDVDVECDDDSTEIALPGWLVEVVTLEGSNYANSDSSGRFVLPGELGNNRVIGYPPNKLWDICAFPMDVSLNNNNITLPAPAQALITCPYMEVDISTAIVKRCAETTYYVRFCNTGTADADNAWIDVDISPDFAFVSTSWPDFSLTGQAARFNLGTVEPMECGRFEITVDVSCNVPIGATHCMEAHIFPDSTCLSPAPTWSGASVDVSAVCEDDSIKFTIENVGTAAMQTPRSYIIIEDAVGYTSDMFQLDVGETITISIPAEGATYRLEAEQVDHHPGRSNPSVVVERCVVVGAQPSLGFFNQRPLDDANDFISIDCQENRSAYDPNDKRGFPSGVGPEHLIEPNTDIEYIIRFQNTGNLPAQHVTIIDTLPSTLNPATISLGASSHEYQFELSGMGVIKFIFDNINLPDSTSNEPESHGFVKFRISQRSDLPIDTKIMNKASIYFDNNAPIVTNIYEHLVGVDIVNSNHEIDSSPYTIHITPNPCHEFVHVSCANCVFENGVLHIFNVHGQLVKTVKLSNAYTRIGLGDLSAGVYYANFSDGHRQWPVGRIVKH